MTEKIAMYVGSFDPITLGHLWMIEQGAKIFDKLIVAVGVNPGKQSMFSLEERIDMIRESAARFYSTEITSFTGEFTVHFARERGAQIVLRGLRNQNDFEQERTMRNINGDVNPFVTTMFLIPPRYEADVSSSMVKSLVGLEGWERVVKKYVPEPVFKKLKEKHYA